MLKNTNHGLTEESPLTLLGGRWWRKKEHPNMILSRSLTSHVIDFLIRAFYCQSNLFQDTKLLELFKDDAFSVASEIQRRAEEGCIANPNTSRGRPIYTDSARGRYFYNPCLRKGPQLRTWSSWGPCCWNGPHLVLILHKRPHFPQSWYLGTWKCVPLP